MLIDCDQQDRAELKHLLLECVEIGLRSYTKTGNEVILDACENLIEWTDDLSTGG